MIAEEESKKINELLARYPAGWLERDVEKVLALWDHDYPAISYMPVDFDAPVKGHAALRKFYEDEAADFLVSSASAGEADIQLLGGLAYAVCDFDWNFNYRGADIALRTRATIVLRMRLGKWYFAHMHESVTWSIPS